MRWQTISLILALQNATRRESLCRISCGSALGSACIPATAEPGDLSVQVVEQSPYRMSLAMLSAIRSAAS